MGNLNLNTKTIEKMGNMNLNTKTIEKMGLLACLYTAQALPACFFSQTIPIFLRQQGVSLESIGLLSLLIIPDVLKFTWAPAIDRYGKTARGHYKFWIIKAQIAMIILLVICSFFNLKNGFNSLVTIIFVLYFAIATQDIATDALGVNLMSERERGIGNGIQVAGSYIGAILGGGVLLLLLERLGWQPTLLGMAVTIGVFLIPISLYREIPAHLERQPLARHTIRSFLTIHHNRNWLLSISIFGMGVGMVVTMARTLLVDIGWSLFDIGILLGIIGSSTGFFSALIAGIIIRKLGLKKAMLLFQGVVILAIATHLLLAARITHPIVVYGAILTLEAAFSMTCTAMYAMIMDRCRPSSAGTDFSLQVSTLTIGGIGIGGGFSGFIVAKVGYSGLFAIGIALCLVGTWMTTKWGTQKFNEISSDLV